MHAQEADRAASLRALRALHRVLLYDLAPRVGIHPGRLGGMLNGKVPLPPDVAEKIAAAIEEAAGR
jgi:DNA-binding transcriptional regulator YdaS (Cro superfamily)